MLREATQHLVHNVIGLAASPQTAAAVHFFIYASIKIFALLAAIIFVLSFARLSFSPEQSRTLLAHRHQAVGNLYAALLGVITPFCASSAVPIFIGFVESGVPLGVTFSFLIASPMVNEVALFLLWGMLGWKIALIYALTGISIAVGCGIVIGRLKMEGSVKEHVWETQEANAAAPPARLPWRQRIVAAWQAAVTLLKSIWLHILFGVAVGAAIHGYVSAETMTSLAGKESFWAVPIALLLGIPFYNSAIGVLPIVHALADKGMATGTLLAFMMAVTALSLPELVLLRGILKNRLLYTFFGIVALSIVLVGFLFNWLL